MQDGGFELKKRHLALVVLMFLALLIPGVRRYIFHQMMKSRMLRNIGIQLAFSMPMIRKGIMNRLMPTNTSTQSE